MNKSLFAFVALGVLAITGCKKEDDTTGAEITWSVGSTNYSSSSLSIDNTNHIIRTFDGNNQLAIYFAAIPQITTTYHVVDYFDASTLAGDEIAVSAATSLDDNYLSTGNDNVSVTVNIDNDGILSITIPPVWAQHYNTNGPQPDSLQIQGLLKD